MANRKQIWHSSQAFHDPRMVKLRAKYGLLGYGYYWILIEILHKTGGKKLLILNDPRLQDELRGMAWPKLFDFIMDCANEFQLFKTDAEYFWSDHPDGNIFLYQADYPGDSLN
jgi:hypothetical protein